ncbi:uncharacterized protein LOC130808709 [Amaranthus tricolor]|uniref:uncharacterized protein LOC130808709 n=1 Tax=Amaranthus tricolor TaxID=29722 RepID=UPI0025858D89|nr:uncharacterized protein LOC130808709 [Amaranthus tricolor]
MPSYAKFLKEVLSNKRKLPKTGIETLRGECSAILECKVPKKEANPGNFTIAVKFSEVLVNKALADLGASVSIMPLSLCKRINADISKTARVVFDMFNGKLTLNILGEDVEFHLPSMMKGPADESLYRAEE